MADGRKVSTATAPASDDDSTIKVTPRKELKDGVIRPNGTIKLKRPAPKHNKPGNWRDGSVVDDEAQELRLELTEAEEKKSRLTATDSPLSGTPNSPGDGSMVNQVDDSTKEAGLTGRSQDDNPDMQSCKHCKKQIPKGTLKSHLESCPAAKEKKKKMVKEKSKAVEKDKEKPTSKSKDKDKGKEKEKDKEKEKKIIPGDEDGEGEDDDDDADGAEEEQPVKSKAPSTGGIKSAKKSAGKKTDAADGDKKGKKRKADGDAEKGPKQKKKKEEPKPKAPKPKGPVDVERQCGVITPTGAPCARSLTCKSHSMGSKRAVPGRSLPYDMLLAAYQKKNQAKQQKAAIDANAPLEDEEEANIGPVDSEEELSKVMPAFLHFGREPLVPQPILEPLKKKYQRKRLQEELDIATRGGTVNIFAVKPRGTVPLQENNANSLAVGIGDGEDAPGEPDYGIMGSRRGSSTIPQQPSQGQRRPSTTSKQ